MTAVPPVAVHAWHAEDSTSVLAAVPVDAASGLSAAEASARFHRYGANRLREARSESVWEAFLEELHEPMILLLLVTGVLYAFWGGIADALTIFAVIFILVAVEVVNERRAKRAVDTLSTLAEPTALVRRSGRLAETPVERIVPGDVILLQAGRRIAADARLIDSFGLAVDESSLTGESTSVAKDAVARLPANASLADRRNMVYAGTTVVRGRGTGVVVATAAQTELGRVTDIAREAVAPRTTLQKMMAQLSMYLAWVAIGFSALIPALGVLIAGQPLRQMLLTGLSLAFSVIPEELPIVITMVLALGAYRLAQQHAIVKRLQAVEMLGGVTVIAADKTGTLTENRMEVRRLYPQGASSDLLEIGVLCNDASDTERLLGQDPLDVALLRAAGEAAIDVQALRRRWQEQGEFTFEDARKRMSIVCTNGARLRVVVKGAPEAVLAESIRQRVERGEETLEAADRGALLTTAEEMARGGLRVLALAEKYLTTPPRDAVQAESELTLVGLVGFFDPPRPGVALAIADCRAAGIRALMMTGDHRLTAAASARETGLTTDARVITGPELDSLPDSGLAEALSDVSVYARITPEHKLRIVRALRAQGERVAVTGDGINDAPALAAADIGIAMGETGTDVAREAADIVLADDNFSTIVRAVHEGRVLFANLTKGVRYYLACKAALIAAALLPVLLGVPVPFAPVQIILMELFMDLAASAAFVAEPGEADLMHRPPRGARAPFMDRAMLIAIFTSAAGLFGAVSLAYLTTWFATGDLTRAQTMAFVTWLLGHVLLALNMRSDREPLLQLGIFSNRVMLGWGVATIVCVAVATSVPDLGALLKAVPLSGSEWALAIGAALAGTFWREPLKLISWRRSAPALTATPQ